MTRVDLSFIALLFGAEAMSLVWFNHYLTPPPAPTTLTVAMPKESIRVDLTVEKYAPPAHPRPDVTVLKETSFCSLFGDVDRSFKVRKVNASEPNLTCVTLAPGERLVDLFEVARSEHKYGRIVDGKMVEGWVRAIHISRR